ncbi:hypothetical protein CGRA01v4_03153 [Colletotrichum graminicola]|nr:hypothetical protein CGRA01v4_03153 [Colletotrichum graminicola]
MSSFPLKAKSPSPKQAVGQGWHTSRNRKDQDEPGVWTCEVVTTPQLATGNRRVPVQKRGDQATPSSCPQQNPKLLCLGSVDDLDETCSLAE